MVLVDRLPDAQRDKRLGADRFTLLGGPAYRLFADALGRARFGQRHIFSIFTSAHEPLLWEAITRQQPYPVKALIAQYHNPLGGTCDPVMGAWPLRAIPCRIAALSAIPLQAASP